MCVLKNTLSLRYTNNYRNDCELSRSDYSPITALKDRLVFKILTDNVILIELITGTELFTDKNAFQ